MKKKAGFSTGGIVAIVVVVAILVVGTILVINHNNSTIDYEPYLGETIVNESEDNGQIGDHIRGNAEAPVMIHEYANFQCNHCAAMAPIVKQAVADSNGQLAIVFRNMTWSAFQNSRSAAAAAEAAGLQGYWEQYADKLFDNQAEWAYAEGQDRTDLYNRYFEEVTNGEGDMEKFQADIASDAVSKKIDFDSGLAQQEGAEGTPAFFIDGQLIDLSGGEIVINDKTIQFEAIDTAEKFVKLANDIAAAKTGA